MRMEVSLQIRLEQKLRLAPQIIQSIEILQLPALELQDLVKEALQENPTLEEVQGTPTDEDVPAEGDLERELDDLERIDAVWNDYFSRSGGGSAGAEATDRKWEAMQNTAAPSITLPEYLIQQLSLLELPSLIREQVWSHLDAHWPERVVQEIRSLAEFICNNLDNNGYLPYTIGEIAASYMAQNGGEAAEGDSELVGEEDVSAVASPEGEAKAEGEEDVSAPEVPSPPVAPPIPVAAPPVSSDPVPVGNGANGHAPPVAEEAIAAPSSTNGVMELAAGEALRIIQTLEPPGVGGRSLKEVLLLQLGDDPEQYQQERRLIENHLPDIQNNRFPKIAKALGADLEQVKEWVAFIKMLNPRPGSLYAAKAAQYIIPDVVVLEVDGDYEVRLENTYIPRIHISPHYRRMLAEQRDNPKVREFIKKKLEAAKWLIESIEQRQNTLSKISREIVKVQRAFFDYGIEQLRPLKMQQIADRVGVHVSTVSRALSDKYVQTPRGIYPLKFFFTGGTLSHDGKLESTASIKQKLRDIVDREDKSHPLSDEEIARILKENQGLDIARRTITKYRKQLSIPSSRQRRTY